MLEDLGDPLGKYVPVGGTLRPPDLHALSKEQIYLDDGVRTPWECKKQASALQGLLCGPQLSADGRPKAAGIPPTS